LLPVLERVCGFGWDRAWADEGHLSSDNVQKLRELIDMAPAEKATDPAPSFFAKRS